MNYVLEGITDDTKSNLMHAAALFRENEIFYNKIIIMTPLVAALIGNNVELINDILTATVSTDDQNHRQERNRYLDALVLFYIKNQTLHELTACLSTFDQAKGKLLIGSLSFHPQPLN